MTARERIHIQVGDLIRWKKDDNTIHYYILSDGDEGSLRATGGKRIASYKCVVFHNESFLFDESPIQVRDVFWNADGYELSDPYLTLLQRNGSAYGAT